MAVGRPTMGRECEQCRARLSEHLDRVLTEREQVAVEAHLDECADCRRELELLRQTVRTVAELPARVPRPGFAER
ncbi:MAG: zf-HC2 domain-containing protein, partial [Candidatus Brocadiae bacterium]|nr:zf-HC2 domain-containing protein [Candidatus Brocadiia bacterium]